MKLALALSLGLLAPLDAHAYLDPGTGSILLQGLIAAVVGGLFALRTWWARIKAFFLRKKAGPPA